MSSFQEVLIGDVCSVGDGAHSKVKRIGEGVPYLTSKNIGQGELKLDKLDFISEESFEKLFPENSKATRRPRPGDVLFGIIGTFGNSYLYKEGDYFGFSSSIGLLRPDPEKLDSEYLYYVVSSEVFKSNHANHNAGSVQGYTNIPTVKSLPIPLPPLAEQKRVSKILKSLDEKIKLNRQANQTLEHIAQAIFKSWFVDFDPTRAKIAAKQHWQALHDVVETSSPTCYSETDDTAKPNIQGLDEAMNQAAMAAISGKTPEELQQLSPEQLQHLQSIAALFPDALVDSELGEIPEGWEEMPFGKLLSKAIGGDWGKEEPDEKHTEKVKILRGTDLPNVYAGDDSKVPTRFVEAKKLATRKLEVGDIVIEVSGGSPTQPTGRSLFVTQEIINRLDSDLEPASFCRLFRPVDSSVGLMLGLHLQKIYEDGKTWFYQNTSTGISNFQTTVFLEKELVILPEIELRKAFYEMVMPYLQRISSAENKELEQLRDALLPKLLSGELEVGEVT